MTIKTTLSFTDRHHRFLKEKVEQWTMPRPLLPLLRRLSE